MIIQHEYEPGDEKVCFNCGHEPCKSLVEEFGDKQGKKTETFSGVTFEVLCSHWTPIKTEIPYDLPQRTPHTL